MGHLKLNEITVRDLQSYRTMRLKTETRRGELTDVATVTRELSTCRAMLNDAVTNDWLLRSPFARAKRGELITVAHESKRKITAASRLAQAGMNIVLVGEISDQRQLADISIQHPGTIDIAREILNKKQLT